MLKLSEKAKALFFNGKPNPRQDQIERVFLRLFHTDDGQRALQHLQASVYERVLGADASDAQLRYLEGQRSVIAMIFRLIEKAK